mmetsp:Transcript_30789/g.37319  ORF Transcript_30789/g.37319 Transcript_30789/m.37319 type:complete len:184 (-) Transcript_30789:333-884(-)
MRREVWGLEEELRRSRAALVRCEVESAEREQQLMTEVTTMRTDMENHIRAKCECERALEAATAELEGFRERDALADAVEMQRRQVAERRREEQSERQLEPESGTPSSESEARLHSMQTAAQKALARLIAKNSSFHKSQTGSPGSRTPPPSSTNRRKEVPPGKAVVTPSDRPRQLFAESPSGSL